MTTRTTTALLVSAALAAAVVAWCLVPASVRHSLARDAAAPYGRAATLGGGGGGASPRPFPEGGSTALATLAPAYQAENAELRRALGFVERNPGLVAAEVLSYGGADAWSQRVRLGKGRHHGLRLHAPVLTEEGLVGHIVELTDTTADVLLLSDPNSHVACEVPDAGGAPVRGILSGAGSALPDFLGPASAPSPLHIDYLDRHATPAPGGLAVTSGLGGLYPRGIALGTVREVTFDTSGLFQRASLEPAVPLHALRVVFVLIGWEGAP